MSSAPVKQGDVVAGKYRIDRILGMGAMGVVVAARHLQLEQDVAIKFLLPEMLHNPDTVRRFAREARAAVKIKSPHVARVIDVGELEGGAPYMVMEYLDGSDLSAWLSTRGTLPVEQAVEFVLQACEALAEAHALGIVHRDLKPANLFVVHGVDGLHKVKVLDFGISKTLPGGSGPDPAMTKTATTMGSPLYMSPEQIESAKSVDARSDIWALGVILHEVVTGSPPFHAQSLPELVLKILSEDPEPLRRRRPELPAELERIVLTCLRKDRNARFANVAELATALSPFATWRARESIDRIGRVIAASGQPPTPSSPPGPHDSYDPRKGARARAAGTGGSWSGSTSRPGASHSRVVRNVLMGVAVAAVVGYVALHGRAVNVSAVAPHDGTPGAAAAPAAAPETNVHSPTAAPPVTAPGQQAPVIGFATATASAAETTLSDPTLPPRPFTRPPSGGARSRPSTVSSTSPAPPAAAPQRPPSAPSVNDAYDTRK